MSARRNDKNAINLKFIVINAMAIISIMIAMHLFASTETPTTATTGAKVQSAAIGAEVESAATGAEVQSAATGAESAATGAKVESAALAEASVATGAKSAATGAEVQLAGAKVESAALAEASAATASDKRIKPYIDHINERFAILNKKLSNNTINEVIIAGNEKANKHALGANLAVGQWKSVMGEEKGKIYNKIIIKYITSKIKELKNNHADKIKLGPVGFAPPKEVGYWKYGKPRNPPSKTTFHVWGANSGNFNLVKGKSIPGSGQASYFPKQQSGVFGIVTTPLHGPPNEPSIDNYS
tara:strand:+ start:1629 stop:2525 length:897 start_codon:yes stop_codon:yes gene_type:complete